MRDDLVGRLSYSFADPSLLDLALSHRSWCAENPGNASNERLEFLGDAVLGLAIAENVYLLSPDAPEGNLAQVRSAVVSAPALAEVAEEFGVGEALRLGKGEALSGGAGKQSILADSMEAIIGAIFLDGGWAAAQKFVVDNWKPKVADASDGPGGQDWKTRLQEYSAAQFGEPPVYEVSGSGPDHAKEFESTVLMAGSVWGNGAGGSKKEAQQAAAREAWRRIRESASETAASH